MSERRPKSRQRRAPRSRKPAPAIRSPRFSGLVLLPTGISGSSYLLTIGDTQIDAWRTSHGWVAELRSTRSGVNTSFRHATPAKAIRALRAEMRRTIKTFTALLKGAK